MEPFLYFVVFSSSLSPQQQRQNLAPSFSIAKKGRYNA
eukprot:CCRYP_020832-RE/>CCRYP_020832-RE protein AED:0.49 eAED:0.49 QI:0/-1/0/1/-1/0/1/0/37